MGPLADIKARLFQRRLKQELGKLAGSAETARPVHLSTARKITILFPADNAEDRKAVEDWRPPGQEGRRITLFGYFNHEVGSTSFSFKAVTVKDLNWYGIPEGTAVGDLRQSHPDLLIRLGPARHRELDYLAAITPAVLKVGPDTLEDNYYHLRFFPDTEDLEAQLKSIEKTFTFINE